ncbi:MAG: hypothetical protein OEZ02_05360 [Anaerolineae bacterium]|nr:hypothetical protein [Anaerolineae bacterium]
MNINNHELILSKKSQLTECLTGSYPNVTNIKVRIPNVSQSIQQKSEQILNRYWNSCGCEFSAISVVAGVVIMLAWATAVPSVEIMSIAFAGKLAIIAFGLGAVGKISGIIYARFRCKSVLNKLLHQITNCRGIPSLEG